MGGGRPSLRGDFGVLSQGQRDQLRRNAVDESCWDTLLLLHTTSAGGLRLGANKKVEP
jgi:hypothetical protein